MNSHHDVDIVLFLVWKNERLKAVVVTQLAKWSLVRIPKFQLIIFTVNYFEKMKIKKKRPGIAHLKNYRLGLNRKSLNAKTDFKTGDTSRNVSRDQGSIQKCKPTVSY